MDGPIAFHSPMPTVGDGGPRGWGFQLASALLLLKEAPCLEQSRALGRAGREVVHLPLGVSLDWSDDISIMPVLGTPSTRQRVNL